MNVSRPDEPLLPERVPPAREHPLCGTPKGYKRHLRAKEEPCDPCRAATAAYVAERRAATPGHRVRAARAAAARRVAMRQLMTLHTREYASLLRAARREAGL